MRQNRWQEGQTYRKTRANDPEGDGKRFKKGQEDENKYKKMSKYINFVSRKHEILSDF